MFSAVFIVCSTISVILAGPLSEDEYELNKATGITEEDLALPDNYVILSPQQRIEDAGYTGETHKVVTEDGYILEMHRISGSKKHPKSDKKPAVFLMHGLLDCSVTWVMSTPHQSLGFILADWGYDVWMGNARGTRYSRKHLNLTTRNKQYWSFSWHEIGMYDLPALIDYVLEKTKQEKIFYIGHSQGGTSFFVMASERPEYQDKLIAAFTLAPAVFLKRTFSPPMRLLLPFADDIKGLMNMLGMYEFMPTGKIIREFAKVACDSKAITEPLCANVIFLIDGYGDKELNRSLISTIAQYDPAGASILQLMHYAQLIKTGRFQQLNHGTSGNLKKYGQTNPPEYDLSKVKMPVYLYYSSNDWMVNTKDLVQLYNRLSNAQKFLVPLKSFSHLDFVWGIHVNTLIYNKILSLMSRHTQEIGV